MRRKRFSSSNSCSFCVKGRLLPCDSSRVGVVMASLFMMPPLSIKGQRKIRENLPKHYFYPIDFLYTKKISAIRPLLALLIQNFSALTLTSDSFIVIRFFEESSLRFRPE